MNIRISDGRNRPSKSMSFVTTIPALLSCLVHNDTVRRQLADDPASKLAAMCATSAVRPKNSLSSETVFPRAKELKPKPELSRQFYILWLASVLTLLFAAAAWGQAQPVAFEPPDREAADRPQFKAVADHPWDLRKFYEMDDPGEAAKTLRAHARKHGIPLDQPQPAIKTRFISGEPKEAKTKVRPDSLIRVFSGAEFAPAPGVERSLSARANRLVAESKGEQKLVCILQLQGPMTMGDIIELLEAGVKVYEPVGPSAVIVRLPTSSLAALQSRPYVRWIGEYRPEYKYDPKLSASTMPGAFIYPLGGDKPEYRADLGRLGIQIRGYDKSAGFYDVVLDVARFREVAEALWWVKGIHKEPEMRVHAMLDEVSVNFEPNDSRELIMAYDTPYSGDGVCVGVRDVPVYDTHPQLVGIFHPASQLDGTDIHGTHVTGIIAGRYKVITGPWSDSRDSNVMGVAPSAGILFRVGIGPGLFGLGYSDDFDTFRSNSIQVSNHSYGWTTPSGGSLYDYNWDTANYDSYCDNYDMVLVVSAGNESDEENAPPTRNITNPATGRNVIAVGAVGFASLARPYIIGERTSYSSQGPTAEDGRLKPDLVAPGGYLINWGVVGPNSDPWQIELSEGGAFSGRIDGNWEQPEWETDDYYIPLSGTSMAAPHVTGVCAKIKGWCSWLSSEQMKAVLINTTIPLKASSTDALAAYANTQVGYGLVNAFSPTHYYPGESLRLLFDGGWIRENDTSLQHDWSISVPAETKKLVVTLAYNDDEGDILSYGPGLRDNMDLILISPGARYYFAYDHKAAGVTGESPLEKMVITNPTSGSWRIRVRFTDSPGFPAHDPLGLIYAEQRYAVVADAILKTPSLALSVPETTIEKSRGEPFTIQPRVTNTGGYIAAGVTVEVREVDGPLGFGGDINKSRYVGNLLYQNASVSPEIELVAPPSPGTYRLLVLADGINREFSGYPRAQLVTVVVSPPDDNYEPNDTYAEAYDLRTRERTWLSSISGLGIQRDYDWYETYVTPGYENVVVDCTFTHTEGNIDIALHNSSGGSFTPIYGNRSSTTTTNNERIDCLVPSPGTYYIRVYYGNQGNTYDLWWDDLRSPAISRIPSSLTSTCMQGQNAPSDVFDVWNSGGATLSYTLTETVGWISSITPSSGTSTGGHNTHTVNYSTSALPPGIYEADVTISAPGATNTPQYVHVTLTVSAAPAVARNPSSLTPSCIEGQNAPNDTFEVWNSGGATLNYTLTESAGWIASIAPPSGNSAGGHNLHTVNYSTAGLSQGSYETDIAITASAATNTPQYVHVTLTVNPSGYNSISGTVMLNAGAASVTDVALELTGDVTQTLHPQPDGTYTFSDLEDGNYVVTPSLAGYGFIPQSRQYSPLTSDQTGQDFEGVPSDVYVAVGSGSDVTGDGTQVSPWATIGHAIGTVVGTELNPVAIHVAQGTYYESLNLDSHEHLYGGYEASTWTRDIEDNLSTIDASTADGGVPADRVIIMDRTTNARVDGFRITGAVNDVLDSPGGGIFCYGAGCSNFVTNCLVTGNSASGGGGGIYCVSGGHGSRMMPIITGCKIIGNAGGGIYCDNSTGDDPTSVVRDCVISGNAGPGVMCDHFASPTIMDCVIAGNSGDGVLCLYSGTYPAINNCIISGNSHSGVYCSESRPVVTNCTISSNSEDGVWFGNLADPQIRNTILTDNGGFAVNRSDLEEFFFGGVNHCLFSNNAAGDCYDAETDTVRTGSSETNALWWVDSCIEGDPMFIMGALGTWTTSPAYDAVANETMLTDSAASFTPDVLVDKLIDADISQRQQALIASNTATSIVVVGDLTAYVELDDTYQLIDYHVQYGSPCIDTGTSAGAPSTDMDGGPRPVDIVGLGADGSGAEYDIGAYEFAAVMNVPGDYLTIQQAINAASDGCEIIVSPGTYVENIYLPGKNIVLRSTDPANPGIVASTVIDGDGAGSVVTFSGTESPACVLSGFTITNGDYLVGNGSGVYGNGTLAAISNNVINNNGGDWGGGLHNCDGTIENNTIAGNSSPNLGGGLFGCDGTIRNNIVRDNYAYNGAGGLYNCNGIIEGNDICSNSAWGDGGGGLYGCDGTIQNNVIWNNSTLADGGGLLSCDGPIQNNTIYGNSAGSVGGQGGGLSSCSGVTNCIIWQNVAPFSPQVAGSSPSYSCIQDWTGGGTGNITSDPQFADPSNGDFHLQATSLCVDAGCSISGLIQDFEGDPRPIDATSVPRGDGSDFDIGADEYAADIDSDGDGISDAAEGASDVDGDAVPNYLDTDSDGDGIDDADEVSTHGTDPYSADSDGDGIGDADEVNIYGTNPNSEDSDGDGVNDAIEIADGTDANLSGSLRIDNATGGVADSGTGIRVDFPAGCLSSGFIVADVSRQGPAPIGTLPDGLVLANVIFTLEPSGTTFDPPVTVTVVYNGADLMDIDETSLVPLFYEESTNTWSATGIELASHDTETNTIIFTTNHFTLFALAGYEQPPVPTLSSLTAAILCLVLLALAALLFTRRRLKAGGTLQ